MARDHDGQARSRWPRPDREGQRSQQPGRSQWPGQVCEVQVREIKAEFATARDHDGQAKFAKSRPSLQSQGQVCKVKAKFVKSRLEITTARQDHDGQARTTGKTTTARQGRRQPGKDDDGQAEFATATVRSFRPIQVREVRDHDGTPFQGGKFTMRSRA